MMEVFGDGDLFNSKNDDGNTNLHIAAIQKQKETVEFLLHHPSVDVNILNHKGLTTLDILSAEKETPNDDFANAEGEIPLLSISDATNLTNSTTLKKKTEKKNGRCEDNNWVTKKRDAVMVVASLLATMAFQAGVNPPKLYPNHYKRFIIDNTIGFLSSLSIILLLVSGLPIRRRLFMWILMIIMWIAISSMSSAYLEAIIGDASNLSDMVYKNVYDVINVSVYFWKGLIALLVIAHTIRLLVRIRAIKQLGKTITKRMRKRKQSVDNITL